MRPIERIDNFLNKVDWHKMFYRWKYQALPILFIGECDKDNFIKYWKENPDQRIGQVLINLGLIPDSLQVWNDEESDILEAQGLPPEEYLFWTSYYDANENILEKPITRLVKNLTKEHILAIKAFAIRKNQWLPPKYNQAFNNVLNK